MKKYALFIFSLALLITINSCSVSTFKDENPSDYLRQTAPQRTPLIFAPGIVSVRGRFEMGFTMTPDGKSMAFGVAHETDPSQTNIRFINWKNGDWAGPDLSPLTDNSNTSLPMFGPKGKKLYFAKTDATGDNDLWVADYKNMQTSGVKSMGEIVNSDEREAGHGQSLQGNFYFTSNRDDQYQCCGDVYKISAEKPDSAIKVTALNSIADEEGLFLSPKEDYIIIQAWKNEYQSKHDLFISYQTDEGKWTVPERLDDKINGPEIEQRPYVTADNQFLFFSRMSIEEKQGKTLYESDIYWVNTEAVFKPFLNRSINTFPITNGENFSIQLSQDLFKDINDPQLNYTLTLANGDPIPSHLSFNSKTMTISGSTKGASSLTFSIKATDKHQNQATTYLEIITKR